MYLVGQMHLAPTRFQVSICFTLESSVVFDLERTQPSVQGSSWTFTTETCKSRGCPKATHQQQQQRHSCQPRRPRLCFKRSGVQTFPEPANALYNVPYTSLTHILFQLKRIQSKPSIKIIDSKYVPLTWALNYLFPETVKPPSTAVRVP